MPMKSKARQKAISDMISMLVNDMGMLDPMEEKKKQAMGDLPAVEDDEDLEVVEAVPIASESKKQKPMQISMTRLAAMGIPKKSDDPVAKAMAKRSKKRGRPSKRAMG